MDKQKNKLFESLEFSNILEYSKHVVIPWILGLCIYKAYMLIVWLKGILLQYRETKKDCRRNYKQQWKKTIDVLITF